MLVLVAPSAAAVPQSARRLKRDARRCTLLSVAQVLKPGLSKDRAFDEALARVQPADVPILSVLTADALRATRTLQFNATAAVWGLPFLPIGSHSCFWPQHGFRWLARSYAEATAQLARRSPKQVAVVMDSQDAFVQGTADEIRASLRASGKPLMLVLETGCAKKRCTTPAPLPGEEANSSRLVGIPELIHINGGVVVGEAHALEVMWRFVGNNTYTGNRMFKLHSAQHGIGKFVQAHPELVAFDRTQTLAAVINSPQSKRGDILGGLDHEWTRYYDTERLHPPRSVAGLVVQERVINRATRRAPCFVHVPGTQEYKRTRGYMNKTMRAWDEIRRVLVPTSSHLLRS